MPPPPTPRNDEMTMMKLRWPILALEEQSFFLAPTHTSLRSAHYADQFDLFFERKCFGVLDHFGSPEKNFGGFGTKIYHVP